jgi:hypothetical protein
MADLSKRLRLEVPSPAALPGKTVREKYPRNVVYSR